VKASEQLRSLRRRLRCGRKAVEQVQPFAEHGDRFLVGAPISGALRCPQPAANRPFDEAGGGVVACQRRARLHVRAALLHDARESTVQAATRRIRQALIRGVADQRVLEGIERICGRSIANRQLRGDQSIERGLQLLLRPADQLGQQLE
jgi:hypothetical protein